MSSLIHLPMNTGCITHKLRQLVVKLALVIALSAVVVPACAQMLFNGPTGSANVFTDTVGYAFTVKNEPLSAHRLGVWDDGGTGFDSINLVGLWQEGGALLATAILPSGSSAPIESGFRWFDLSTPVILNANTTYRLGVQADLEMQSSGFVTGPISPHINLLGAVRNNQQNNFTYPGSTPFAGQAIVGPNLGYTVVPEPSVAHLIAATAIALFATRWLKKLVPRKRRVAIQRRIRQ